MARLIRTALGGLPLIARLPLARAAELGEAAARAGADALTVGAPPRVSVQVDERTLTGRLYSPDNFPAALEAIQSAKTLGLPLIGAGGVYSPEDAQAMLEAGAVAVQVDAALWNDPGGLVNLLWRFTL